MGSRHHAYERGSLWANRPRRVTVRRPSQYTKSRTLTSCVRWKMKVRPLFCFGLGPVRVRHCVKGVGVHRSGGGRGVCVRGLFRFFRTKHFFSGVTTTRWYRCVATGPGGSFGCGRLWGLCGRRGLSARQRFCFRRVGGIFTGLFLWLHVGYAWLFIIFIMSTSRRFKW